MKTTVITIKIVTPQYSTMTDSEHSEYFSKYLPNLLKKCIIRKTFLYPGNISINVKSFYPSKNPG